MDDLEHWQIDYVREAMGFFGFAAVMLVICAGLVGVLAVIGSFQAGLA